MERKTKVSAGEGQQEIMITREFALPVDLLFKAYAEPAFVEQWMGTHVVKLESRKHGSYQYETKDEKGNLVFAANGVIHEFIPGQQITRTFEMNNTPFGVQLELYAFTKLSEDTSKLTMRVIYESVAQRNQVLQLPFAQGIDMAHTRIETIMSKLK